MQEINYTRKSNYYKHNPLVNLCLMFRINYQNIYIV